MKVAFLARSLEYGGSERQLVVLAKLLQQRGNQVVVILFYGGGPLESELRAAGVRVHALGKRHRWDVFGFAARLRGVLREERPAVLHGYLPVPNLVALAMRFVRPGMKIIWGERSSDMDLSRYDRLSRLTASFANGLSRFADLIIVNSRAGFECAASRGYPTSRMVVVPNGIDTDRFRPDRQAGLRLREEWNVEPGQRLVGIVARLDRIKDHPTWLAAASLLRERADVRFVCVGAGPAKYQRELRELSAELGIRDRVIWADARADVTAVYGALDVLCSSSMSEGFPNVVAEAMACGVPCVVTDAGDSAWLLGDPSLVAARGDAGGLAERIGKVLDGSAQDVDRLRSAGRERILVHFSLGHLADATEDVLAGLTEGRGR